MNIISEINLNDLNGNELRNSKRDILAINKVEYDKLIVVVHWLENSHTPFSTHVIYPEGSTGLYHGNYYSSLVEAVENFKVRK